MKRAIFILAVLTANAAFAVTPHQADESYQEQLACATQGALKSLSTGVADAVVSRAAAERCVPADVHSWQRSNQLMTIEPSAAELEQARKARLQGVTDSVERRLGICRQMGWSQEKMQSDCAKVFAPKPKQPL